MKIIKNRKRKRKRAKKAEMRQKKTDSCLNIELFIAIVT